MDDLLQVCVMLFLLAVEGSLGFIVLLIIMAITTFVTKDKYFFTKILKKMEED